MEAAIIFTSRELEIIYKAIFMAIVHNPECEGDSQLYREHINLQDKIATIGQFQKLNTKN